MLLPCVGSFLLCVVCGGSADGEHWPAFRGPDHQGHSRASGVPSRWNTTENIAWKTPIPGAAWSSPIVWEKKVFLTTATDEGASCRVLALDRDRGEILWNKEVFRQKPGRKEDRNTYATPTPVTNGQRVYTCFGDGSFAAVDFTGEIAWINRDYPFYSKHGLGSSPVVHRGLLLMAMDGSSPGPDKLLGWQTPWDKSYVLALDTANGKERWVGKRGMSRISHGGLTLWQTSDNTAQIISEAGDVLQGFDPQSGTRIWSSTVAGEGKVPTVVVGDGLAFTSGGWGGKESIKAFRLGGKGDLGESNLVWEQKKGMPKIPSLLYIKPYLYAVTDAGVASCYAAETGEIIWQVRLGGNFTASPVTAEGRIYIVSDEGTTHVLATGPEFKVLYKNPLGEKVQASPAVVNGCFFIRTEKHLFCIREPK